MRNIFIILLSFVLCPTVNADIINKDKPLKGEYVFPLKKVWQLSAAGTEPFALIRQVQVSEKGDVYVHDAKNQRFYIFSGDKKFIRAFGKKGEGPGEIKMIEMAGLFAVDDKLIVSDVDKLHYYSLKGEFIRSVPNRLFRRRPVVFLDENRFVSAPLFKSPMMTGDSEILLNDLKKEKETPLATFRPVERQRRRSPGGRRGFSMAFRGVTPMMVIGYHNNKVYYGMNNRYRLQVTDLEGKKINTFGIDRPGLFISPKDKEQLLSKGSAVNLSPMMKTRILRNLPDKATYFDAVEIHDGLIYVFNSDPGMKNEIQIDIFSLEGKYLYRSFIEIEKESTISPLPLLKKSNLYLILLDKQGNYNVAKYEIKLPTK